MNKHQTTGRWQYGLVLAFIASLFWGVLPVVLKALLQVMDAFTITWFRFLTAAILLYIYIHYKSGTTELKNLQGITIVLFIVASTGLSGNYVIYLLGLNYLTPNTAQVVIQLAPVFLLIGGLVVYKERFSLLQRCGLIILIAGLGLFFNQRLVELLSHINNYSFGVILVILSAVAWAFYGLAQKQLLNIFSSETIMLLIYSFGVFFFLPLIHPQQVLALNNQQLLMLVFAALNTLFAYGSFAEALNHWEASRISAVLAITPIITLLTVYFGAAIFPTFIAPDPLNYWSIIGAMMVVAGSMLSALGRK